MIAALYVQKDGCYYRWGVTPDSEITHMVSWCGNHVADGSDRARLGKKAASASPIEFRDILIGIAMTANKETPAR